MSKCKYLFKNYIAFNYILIILIADAGDMHGYIEYGRHASNPLHGNKHIPP